MIEGLTNRAVGANGRPSKDSKRQDPVRPVRNQDPKSVQTREGADSKTDRNSDKS